MSEPDPIEAGSEAAELRRQQQDEIAGARGAIPVSHAQARGAVVGGLVGGVIGAVLFLPLAAIPVDAPVWARILVVMLLGFVAGATAGAVYLGGREPEIEGVTDDPVTP
jgi:hypothetical protein